MSVPSQQECRGQAGDTGTENGNRSASHSVRLATPAGLGSAA
jgi:hypothetical protein